MMSVFLTKEIKLPENGTLAYYFCHGQDERRNNAAAVLRTLLWQILNQHPDLTQHVLQFFDPPERQDATLASEETLWHLLQHLASRSRDRSLHCVIDGLDECDEDSTLWLASRLAQSGLDSDSLNLYIMVLSRDIAALEGSACIRLDPDNSEHVGADVEMYIRTQVRQLSQKLHFSPGFTEHVVEILLKQSGGTFLWVGFVVAELSRKKTSTQVRQALSILPKGLPAYYARMLENIGVEDRAKSVHLLTWVAMGFRKRLSLKTFADILDCHASEGIDEEQATLDQISICAPMVQTHHLGLTFVHQSVKDYLLRPEMDADPILEEFRIKPEEAHLYIALRCLEALAAGTHLQYYALLNWRKHATCLTTLAPTLIEQASFFFAANAPVRDEWWRKYSMNFRDLPTTAPPRLHIACHLGFEAWVRILLHKKGDSDEDPAVVLDQECSAGWTPLRYAAESESEGILKLLLSNQPLEKARSHLQVLLERSVLADRATVVRLLLEVGADPNVGFANGKQPLDIAIESRQLAIARHLQSFGAGINDRNGEGDTRVHVATNNKRNDELRFLIKLGADLNLLDSKGKSAVQNAIFDDSLDLAQLLVNNNARLGENDSKLYTRLGKNAPRPRDVTRVMETQRVNDELPTLREAVILFGDRSAAASLRELGFMLPESRYNYDALLGCEGDPELSFSDSDESLSSGRDSPHPLMASPVQSV